MPQANIPSEEEVLTYFDKFSNWGKWGDDDELGEFSFGITRFWFCFGWLYLKNSKISNFQSNIRLVFFKNIIHTI